MPNPRIMVTAEELSLMLEKLIKAGRISFSACVWENRDSALPNEIILKYDEIEGVLAYTRDPKTNEIKPIGTETDLWVNKFKANFLEVSDIRSKQDVDPSIWFQTKTSSEGFTNYNQETVNFLYDQIEAQLSSLKPYIMKVNCDGEAHRVIPFMSARGVYYDLSKIMSGQIIRNLEDVFKLMMEYMNKLRSDLDSQLQSLNSIIADAQANISDQNARQDLDIVALEKEVERQAENMQNVQSDVQNLATGVEYKPRPYQVSLQGDPNTAYPIVIRFTEAGEEIEGGFEVFNAETFVVFEDPTRNNVIQLGHGADTTSQNYYSGKTDDSWIFTQHIQGTPVAPAIYDVRHMGPGVWLVMLRGTCTVNIFSKYMETLDIDDSLSAKYGVNPVTNVPNTVINENLTGSKIRNTSFTKRFDSSVQVVGDLYIQNRYRLRIV